MRQRFFSILLVMCLLLEILPGMAQAADTDFVIKDRVLTEYTGPGGDVTIPNNVTSIGKGAFAGCSSLTSVTIPTSVTTIGPMAFENCSSLTSVTIPNSVISIGEHTFYGCSSLISMTIPNGVTSIENGVFRGCSSLTNVIIPNSVTSIGGHTFYGCSSLTSVTIPNSVTSIGWYTFYGCSSLTSVTIPNSVLDIGWCTFSGCSSLTSFTIPSSVTYVGDDTFYGCSSLTSVTIPNSVTYIGGGAFLGCGSLTDICYSGSESQWKQILIATYGNDPLQSAAIHYNNATPAGTPTRITPAQATNAVLSPQRLTVDGKVIDCEKYNIGGSNYFKVRDLAYALNGTASQFAVGFDTATSTVSITIGTAYTPNGSELATDVDNASTAQPSSQTILIDGVERSDLTAYNIGGSNFFQLRELGTALGFEVDFDAASNTAIVRSTKD